MTKSWNDGTEGSQEPRIESVPDGEPHPDADTCFQIIEAAGLFLDDAQKRVFWRGMRRKHGKWAAYEVVLVCPRQNGKNELLIARQLVGALVLEEKLQIHSSHRFDTSLVAFKRLRGLIWNTPWLLEKVKHRNGKPVGIRNSHGEESIEFENGCSIEFRTRVGGGGRGYSADTIYFDEAQELSDETLADLVPTTSARSDPQLWYTGTAVDQLVHQNGIVLARLRIRAQRGEDASLAYFEWSIDVDNPDLVTPEMAKDRALWAQSNFAYGRRIFEAHIAREQAALPPRRFAVERLGAWDPPPVDQYAECPIRPEKWLAVTDSLSAPAPKTPLVFAFDVSPDRKRAAIAVSGIRSDGCYHIEVLPREDGVVWLPAALAALVKEHKPSMVLCDSVGAAASMVPALKDQGVDVRTLTTTEHVRACGMLHDAVEALTLRHRGTPELAAAVAGAVKRDLGEAWAWNRRNSHVDITPLVACTFAHWGATQAKPKYRAAGF